jgi:hypothetical protein
MRDNLAFLIDAEPVDNVGLPPNTGRTTKKAVWRPGDPIAGSVDGIMPEGIAPENADDWQRIHFYMVPNLIYDLGLSSSGRDLYGYYARRAGSGLLRPITEGSERIARKLRLHKKTVLAARRELIERGLIRSDPIRIHGGMGSKVTVLNIWPYVRQMHDSAPG